jgi:hypothetical protein
MKDIEIGSCGQILEGEPKDWYIFIQDDTENTGGYLLLFSASLDKSDSKGYDVWVENLQDIKTCFKEKKWKIHWLDEISL